MKGRYVGLLASGAFAALLHVPGSASAQTSLGTAESFAVLGGSTVTNTGATIITGDLGVSPGSAITGFPPGIVTGGTIHAADAVALQAQTDVTTAYNALAGQACNTNLTGQDLGGLTLTPGVYCFSSSAQLTGMLTLDAQGTPSAEFVFQIGSTLTTATSSSVLVINGADPCNVFWQVGSSATLGTTTTFVGNILALTSISLTTGANMDGRALARNGAVTLDTNNVDASVCAGGATVTPTATPGGPTLTPTPSATSGGPSLTPTPSATSGGPSLTPTPSATSGGPSLTPTPSATSGGPTLTATPTPIIAGTPTPTCPILCVRQDGCFRWELVSADIDAGVVAFTWRLTNRCRQPLAAAKFLFTHGNPSVVGMETGQTYVSPGGFSYTIQVFRGGSRGVMFTARGAGTIRSGQSDLFTFTTTETGIDSETVYWNSAFTTDGQVGRTDIQVGDCPVGCPPEPVLDPSARWSMAATGEWDVMVRWKVNPFSNLRLFDLYRVEPGSTEMAQVNSEPVGPHDDGAASVGDVVAAGMVDRYQIQPLDAAGAAVGPSVSVPVEAASSVVSVDSWLLTLVIAGLGLGVGLLRRLAKSR